MSASALRDGAGLGEAGTLRLLQRSMRVLGCIGNVGFMGFFTLAMRFQCLVCTGKRLNYGA